MNSLQALFTVKDVARIFGLNESRVRYWAQTGFINPSGASGGKRLYTFRDLVAVRAAMELLDRGIPLQRVRKSLLALRDALPHLEQPLTQLRVLSNGDRLVVADEKAVFEPLSGQLVLDFEIEALHARVLELLGGDAPVSVPSPAAGGGVQATPGGEVSVQGEPTTAYGWFLRGCALDQDQQVMEQAVDAYQRALALDPDLAAAHTNLGNLHYARGERAQAQRSYETACALEPEQPQARFNLANLYEEEGALDRAIAEYRRAIGADAEFADAHFNLALTLERVGSRVQALHHWRCFTDLARGEGAEWVTVARERIASLEGNRPETQPCVRDRPSP